MDLSTSCSRNVIQHEHTRSDSASALYLQKFSYTDFVMFAQTQETEREKERENDVMCLHG